MQKHPWIKWLIVLVVLIGVGLVVRSLLAWRGFPTAARIADIATSILASLWCYYGLYLRRDRRWARALLAYLTVSNITWLAAYILYAVGRPQWAANLIGIWTLCAIGLIGVWLIEKVVSAGHPVIGIARTVILQAARLHIVTAVIVAVALMVLLLPGRLDPTERLNYRVSFYLVWSLRLSMFLLSGMTIVLACYTVTYDLSRRQMFMLASKPVGRFQYLAGKWLGLALLNLVLCAIVGVGVWLGSRVLASEPLPEPATMEAMRDRIITDDDVLAARVTAYPIPGEGVDLQAVVKAEFEDLKRQFPQTYPEKIEQLDTQTLSDLRGKAIARWHTIPPGEYRVFVFEGFKDLADEFVAWASKRRELIARYEQLMKEKREDEAEEVAKQVDALAPPATSLRLRIKPKYTTSSPDGMLRLEVQVGGRTLPFAAMPDDTVRELPIPLPLVGADGRLVVAIRNSNPQSPAATHQASIKLTPYEGIEVLYTAGTFEGNLARGLAVHWVRLGFLTMLGIAASTFLGFPMACLVTSFVYGIAVFSSFASESIDAYATFSVKNLSKWDVFIAILKGIWNGIITGEIWSIAKLLITLLGNVVLLIVPSFGYYNSTSLLADGRMVPVSLVLETVLYVGAVGGGACLLIGWLLFRRKELARVTV